MIPPAPPARPPPASNLARRGTTARRGRDDVEVGPLFHLPAEGSTEFAEKRRLLADAQAYEITKINEAIGKNPNYVKLQALKSLEAISKDPAAKVYFIDGDSPAPLPLMHLGDMK